MTDQAPVCLDNNSSNELNSLSENVESKIQQQVKDLTQLLNQKLQASSDSGCNSDFTLQELVLSNDLPDKDVVSSPCTNHNLANVNESGQYTTNISAACSSGVSKKQLQSVAKNGDKLRKENSKGRNKEDRSIEHVLKALQSLKTPEERLAALCKKYSDLLEEHRAVQISFKQSERKNAQVIKDKEQLQNDYSKAILARIRLEGLCRELQRQCKVVKEECVQRIREEEEKRKEVSGKFQTTLNEISTLMQENNQKNSLLHEENLELAQKLKTLVEQYEFREQHIDKIIKHKELELQLSEAKLAKANMMMSEEKEKYLREKQKLLEDLTEYQRRCTEMATNEVQLRAQLNMYTDKYSEFQDTLTKSNQVFTSFKGEMEKMSKKIKKLEKETGSWKTRWENSNHALLEMAEDKQKHDLELLNSQKKIAQLEKLCRAMQVERTALQLQLKMEKAQCGSSSSQDSPTVDLINSFDVERESPFKENGEKPDASVTVEESFEFINEIQTAEVCLESCNEKETSTVFVSCDDIVADTSQTETQAIPVALCSSSEEKHNDA